MGKYTRLDTLGMLGTIVHGSLSTSSAQQLPVSVLHIRMLAIHFIPECFLHPLQ